MKIPLTVANCKIETTIFYVHVRVKNLHSATVLIAEMTCDKNDIVKRYLLSTQEHLTFKCTETLEYCV